MVQQEIEVILTRQLAGYLAVPVFVVDVECTLIFYNEPAERILGSRFDETGAVPLSDWGTRFHPSDRFGAAIPPESFPFVSALKAQYPTHANFWIDSLDNTRRHIEVSAFPLIGMRNRLLGAVAMFWEAEESCE